MENNIIVVCINRIDSDFFISTFIHNFSFSSAQFGERVVSQGYVHFVTSISSSKDRVVLKNRASCREPRCVLNHLSFGP
jgi:hypothetical protein